MQEERCQQFYDVIKWAILSELRHLSLRKIILKKYYRHYARLSSNKSEEIAFSKEAMPTIKLDLKLDREKLKRSLFINKH